MCRAFFLCRLMFRHGLRVSELCAIKLSDINVGTKDVSLTKSSTVCKRDSKVSNSSGTFLVDAHRENA